MSIVVTGATGLLGNNVVRLLHERGEAVRVLVPENANHRSLDDLSVESLTGDIRDAERVEDACTGARFVVHCAGLISFGWSRMAESYAVNVEGTRNVACAARKAGARMVHISSCDTLATGTIERPANEETIGKKTQCAYVVTKTKAESIVLGEVETGLDAVVVNPAYMLGPWDWTPSSGQMLLHVASRLTPFAPRGGTSLCDARDVAAAIVSTMEHWHRGRRYILAGHNMTWLDFWRMIAEVTGGRPPRARLPRTLASVSGLAGDLWGKLSGNEPEINSASIQMSNLYSYYTSDRAKSELGYQNRPARETVQTAWNWFSEYGYT